MPLPNELFRQVRDNAFRAAVCHRRHSLKQRRNLRDFHKLLDDNPMTNQSFSAVPNDCKSKISGV
jgi:hypothetical protein